MRHSRESDGSRNCRSTIDAADRWAKRVLSQASPRSSTQRMAVSSPGSSASVAAQADATAASASPAVPASAAAASASATAYTAAR